MATVARGTRGQVSFAMMDLVLHTQFEEDGDMDIVEVCNETLSEYWMDYGDTAMIASFTHLAGGYAAGYLAHLRSFLARALCHPIGPLCQNNDVERPWQ